MRRSRCASVFWWSWAHERLALATAASGTPPGNRRPDRTRPAGDRLAAAGISGRIAATDDPCAARTTGLAAAGSRQARREPGAAPPQPLGDLAASRRSVKAHRRSRATGAGQRAGAATRPVQRFAAHGHLDPALATGAAHDWVLPGSACIYCDCSGTLAQPDAGRAEAETRSDRFHRTAG